MAAAEIRQQLVQLALLFKHHQLVTAAHMPAIDEYLGHGHPATGSLDPSLEYLVYGLSEGIVEALAHVRKLRVIAPGTAAHYAGSDPDPRDVGPGDVDQRK